MKRLKPNFEFFDDRGFLLEIWKGSNWKRMNYIFSKKGSLRGGHYHKKTSELFFIAEGLCEVKLFMIRSNKEVKFKVEKNDIFIVEPYEVHYIEALKDSKIIAVLDRLQPQKNHDIFFPSQKLNKAK